VLRTLVKRNRQKGAFAEQTGGDHHLRGPAAKLLDTYNGQPLCYAGIAAQKNYYSLYLMGAYGDPKQTKWLADEFKKRGKRLDMGKSCLRFKSLDDIPLDVVGEVIASMPMDTYIDIYKKSRTKTAKGK
jgi:hypothetical protein